MSTDNQFQRAALFKMKRRRKIKAARVIQKFFRNLKRRRMETKRAEEAAQDWQLFLSTKSKSEQLMLSIDRLDYDNVIRLLDEAEALPDKEDFRNEDEEEKEKRNRMRLNVNYKDPENGETALMRACRRGQFSIVKALLEFKVKKGVQLKDLKSNPHVCDGTLTDDFGYTALMHACMHGRLYCVTALEKMAKCPSWADKDQDGWTPILHAADRGHWHIIAHVASGKKKKKKRSGINSDSSEPQVNVSRANVDLAIRSRRGETPLFKAAAGGHFLAVRTLLDEMESEMNTKNVDGFTPLMIAAFYGHLDIVEYLVKRGANDEEKNNYGQTVRTMLPSAMALKNYKGGVHLSPKQDEALEQLRQIIIRVVKKAIELKLQRRNDNMKDQILKPNYFQHKSLGGHQQSLRALRRSPSDAKQGAESQEEMHFALMAEAHHLFELGKEAMGLFEFEAAREYFAWASEKVPTHDKFNAGFSRAKRLFERQHRERTKARHQAHLRKAQMEHEVALRLMQNGKFKSAQVSIDSALEMDKDNEQYQVTKKEHDEIKKKIKDKSMKLQDFKSIEEFYEMVMPEMLDKKDDKKKKGKGKHQKGTATPTTANQDKQARGWCTVWCR